MFAFGGFLGSVGVICLIIFLIFFVVGYVDGKSGIISFEIKEGRVINVIFDPDVMEKEGITQQDYDSYARAWALKLSQEKQRRKSGSEVTAYIFVGDEEVATINYSKTKRHYK